MGERKVARVKKSIFLTVLLGLFLLSTAFALEPGDSLWTRTYGGGDDEIAYSVQQTTDGGYIIAGYTTSFGAGAEDVYLVKTDANGDTLWTRTYGGTATDYGWSIQQTSDDGYIVAGWTKSFGAGGEDVYLVKTDADGNTLWTRTYGGSQYEEAWSVQQTTDGGYIITGYTYSFGAGGGDIWLLKTDANGDTLWTRTYGGSEYDDAWSVQQTSDGGYIVAGQTRSFGAGSYDLWLLKTDANGDILWTRTYGGGDVDYGRSVQRTPDGAYIVAGYTRSFGAGDMDLWLLKTDANGDTLWTRTYGGTAGEYTYSVQQTTDGGYIIAGETMSFGAGVWDVYPVKTDANGDTLWTRVYGGSAADYAYSVQQTSDGAYVIAGGTMSFGPPGKRDVWLLKLAGEAPQPDVSIEIVPDDPPVTVPQGGSFGFTGTVTNNTEDPQTTDIWVMAVGPSEGVYGPFKEFYDLTLDPGQSRTAHFNQHVKGAAPLGFYDYIAYCGDYPSTVMDSSFFQVEVVEGVGSSQVGWVLTGSFLEGDLSDLPCEFALLSNYPNPFNAQTVIEYQLPVSSSVKLEVYNLLGNKVTTLVDGEQEAGYKSVTWDASGVSSGIYFYKLSAGDYTEAKRMMLVK
jgi:hypothetical protein